MLAEASTTEDPMAYLDVSPMTAALRTTPEMFEMDHGWLHHLPSHHRFSFGPKGDVQLSAQCDCSLLAVKPDQEAELAVAFGEWRQSYWRAIEINREFAAHFARPSAFRRLLIALTGAAHRRLMRTAASRAHYHPVPRRVAAS
jgi:hypothetical protein